jgi:preprotein translocase subunit SecA
MAASGTAEQQADLAAADRAGGGGAAVVQTIKRKAPKVGRNDPCPCGSGKKYKQCCGRA